MATAAKDVDTLPPSESAPGRKRPRPGRKNATAPDLLRIEIAKALEIDNIPQMQPLFPGLPRKTDFRKLAINLNLRVKRPVDHEIDADGDEGSELLVPGHYTRYQTDEVIARWAAEQVVSHSSAIGEMVGTNDHEQQVDQIAAALFIDKSELDEFINKAVSAGKNDLLDVGSLSSLFSAPERFITLRRDDLTT